jgi:hypothetical protein
VLELSHSVIHLSSHGDVVHQLWGYVHRHLHLETLRGPATLEIRTNGEKVWMKSFGWLILMVHINGYYIVNHG